MTIYLDVIFLENFIMNYIIIYATSLISKNKNNKMIDLKKAIASAIGAIYVILQYVTKLELYSNAFIKVAVSLIIVWIAFRPLNFKSLFKNLLLFYLTTFTFGGVATYLIYVIKPQDLIMKDGVYVGTYVLKVVLIGAIIGTFILFLSFKLSKNKITKKDIICKIRIKLNNKEIELNAIVDTGNMLKEPLTGNPVVVVEKTSLYGILPDEILDNTEKILGGDFSQISEKIKTEYIPRLKIIPYSSLGKQNGMMLGIKLEKFEMLNEETEEKNNVIIGIYNKSLTKRGEYNAIVGIELF